MHRLVIRSLAMGIDDSLPTDLASAHALIVAQRQALSAAEIRAAAAESEAQYRALLIEKLKFTIRKLRHDRFGQSSERGALLDQLELQLADLEADAAQAQVLAQIAAVAASEKMVVPSFERRRPARRPLPEHLPRERTVYPALTVCLCCGGSRLRKLGETVTETLESVPRQWKVIQHVREKFTCRDCEKISQAPAPFHVIARGWAGPSLLAMILFEKFGQHQPLNRQAERYAREGVPLSLSTLADQVGAGCAVLEPILRRIEAHVFAAERLHGDDTTVPVLAKGKTDTGRCWVYVRDDLPFGGPAPPAAMFYYSRDRAGEHPRRIWPTTPGFSRLTLTAATTSSTSPIASRGQSWKQLAGSMPSSVLADVAENARRKAQGKTPAPISPLALEAVRRIDALFEIERSINGQSAEQRRAVRTRTQCAVGR